MLHDPIFDLPLFRSRVLHEQVGLLHRIAGTLLEANKTSGTEALSSIAFPQIAKDLGYAHALHRDDCPALVEHLLLENTSHSPIGFAGAPQSPKHLWFFQDFSCISLVFSSTSHGLDPTQPLNVLQIDLYKDRALVQAIALRAPGQLAFHSDLPSLLSFECNQETLLSPKVTDNPHTAAQPEGFFMTKSLFRDFLFIEGQHPKPFSALPLDERYDTQLPHPIGWISEYQSNRGDIRTPIFCTQNPIVSLFQFHREYHYVNSFNCAIALRWPNAQEPASLKQSPEAVCEQVQRLREQQRLLCALGTTIVSSTGSGRTPKL